MTFCRSRLLLLAHFAVAMTVALVVLRWDQPPADQEIVRWRVYRAVAPGGTFALLKSVKTTSTRVEVPAGTTRCYKVKAVNSLGQASPYSATVCHAEP